MYNFALLFLAVSVGIPTAATNLIGFTVAKAPQAEAEAEVNRRLQAECSCSPRSFTFQLNFNQICADNTIKAADRPGVSSTFCQISPFEDPTVDDLTPVQIEEVVILELNPSFEVIKQENISSTLIDGDTFTYTSVSAQLNPDEPLGDQSQEVPRVIQLNIFGVNAVEQPIVNFFAVAYSMNCDAEPPEPIVVGDKIGWVEVVEPYTFAIAAFCPAIETEPPTTIPSLSPTTSEPTTEQPTTEQPTTEQPTPIPTWPLLQSQHPSLLRIRQLPSQHQARYQVPCLTLHHSLLLTFPRLPKERRLKVS